MRSDPQLEAILQSLEQETEKNDLVKEERDRRNAARKNKIQSDLNEGNNLSKLTIGND